MSAEDKIQRAIRIVKSFESGKLSEMEALSQLKDVTGRTIDSDWLKNYWRAESIDDFVDRLCALPINNWQTITEMEAEKLIVEYLNTPSPGRRDSIETALERRFRKAKGTLNDLVFQKDFDDLKRILDELRKDASIYL